MKYTQGICKDRIRLETEDQITSYQTFKKAKLDSKENTESNFEIIGKM